MTQPSSIPAVWMHSWRFHIPPTSNPPTIPPTIPPTVPRPIPTTTPPQLHSRPAPPGNRNTTLPLPVPANLQSYATASEPSLQLKTPAPSEPPTNLPKPGQMPETGQSISSKRRANVERSNELAGGDLRSKIMTMKKKITIVDETLRTCCGPGGLREPDDALQEQLLQTLYDFKYVASLNGNDSWYQPAEGGVESTKSLMQQLILQFLTLLHRRTAMLNTFIGLPAAKKKIFMSSTGTATKLKTLVWLQENHIDLTDKELENLGRFEHNGPIGPRLVADMIRDKRQQPAATDSLSGSSEITAKKSWTFVSAMNASGSHHPKKRHRPDRDPEDPAPRTKRSRIEAGGTHDSLNAQPQQAQFQAGIGTVELELYDDFEQYLQGIHAPAAPFSSSAASANFAETLTYPVGFQQAPDLLMRPGPATGTAAPPPSPANDGFNAQIEDWDMFGSDFLSPDHES